MVSFEETEAEACVAHNVRKTILVHHHLWICARGMLSYCLRGFNDKTKAS